MTERGRLDGQVAFVTGGGGGIGRGIALRLAGAGRRSRCSTSFRNAAPKPLHGLPNWAGEALALPGDAMDTEALRSAIAVTDVRFGRLDILVNNVGGVSGRPFLEQSERSWRRHIDINLVSMLAATHAAAPIMIRGGRGGAILNVASIEAERAAPNFLWSTRPARPGWSASPSRWPSSFRVTGIRVNCISPDHTVTPGNQGNRAGPVDPASWRTHSPEEIDAMNRLIPLGREGVDSECGDAAIFLCSSQSSYNWGGIAG